MKRILLGTLAAAAVSFSTFTLTSAATQSDKQPPPEERMQHWAAARQKMLHAKLDGMKAGLGLTADQETLWIPFVSALDGVFKSRTETMQKTMKAREGGERVSPVDRMAQGAAELKTISDAARPLYDNLDDTQKRNFELLGRGLVMAEPRPQSDLPSVEWDYRGGNAGYSWEPYDWSE